MDHPQHLRAIETHGALVARAARTTPDAPVKACGAWRVADVLWHLGEVHRFWLAAVDAAGAMPKTARGERSGAQVDAVTWFEEGLSLLVQGLSQAPVDHPCWTWAGLRDVAWVTRRMAHETTVHSWDTQWAAGMRPEIEPGLASDGIDEFMHVMTPLVREGQPVVGGSVHVHCTDVEGEWMAVPGDGLEMTVTREHAKGSVALRGAASDLYLVLWRRLPLDIVEVFGDAAVAERFLLRADLD